MSCQERHPAVKVSAETSFEIIKLEYNKLNIKSEQLNKHTSIFVFKTNHFVLIREVLFP